MKKTVILLSAAILLTGTSLYAQTITLKFNPDNGSKYQNTTTSQMKMNQTVMGQSMEIQTATHMDLQYAFTDAAPDKNLEITYDKMNMNMELMGQKMEFNSESADSANAGNKTFKAIKGSKINVVIGSDGSVKSVKGTDELAAKAGADNAQAKQLLKQLFSEAALKSSFEQSLKFYPNDPVKQGSTWALTTKVESPYNMTFQNNYTLSQINGDRSTINVDGKVSTEGAAKFEQQGMSMEITLDGTNTGTLMVNNKTGIPESSDLVQHLKGKVNAMGQEIPVEIDIESKSTITKQ
ncbi:hypothetical protein A8C56_15430 [Niabella ginsenosidivorans]|uniref:DUF4412 domain-containing protein n=1 Tax=Niabella ginsenosidivorans TaxID=1176587 RepID=A0A1A9I6L0_9BACT|nr:DUF6263 family protein [Niabella ginsenosidivorans]ANH82174.1 hypothetical protein A8C56_15430 [Niabella ginsenosidivorans]